MKKHIIILVFLQDLSYNSKNDIPLPEFARICHTLFRYLFIPSRHYHPFKVKRLKIGEMNIGMIDRVVRIIIGIVLIAVFALNMVAAPWSYLVALIGLIALVTGVIGTCPLYSLLNMSTLEKKA